MRCCAKERQGIPLEPIYCDNHILVLEKPAGMATQPDFHESAKIYIKEAFAKPGEVFLEPIHRLDKPVSGLVLFARTSKALSRLNASMRGGQIRKRYRARVEGVVPEEGKLEHYLLHGNFRAIVDPSGKKASLLFWRLESKGDTSLVEVELLTGRYHQIRAQFSAIGHPIVGDAKYGSKTNHSTIKLHHHTLTFPHPTKGEMVECTCPASF